MPAGALEESWCIMMKKRPRILVVGSLVMDLIVTTEVFPHTGETVLGSSFHSAPGGKGANQAIQAARLGAEVDLVGCVGQDAFGQTLRRSAEESGIHTERLRVCEGVSSAIGNIILEQEPSGGSKNRIIVVPGANMEVGSQDVQFLKHEIAGYDMVLMQLEIPMETNLLVAQYASQAGVPVMLNPAPAAPLPEELLKRLTYLSPNEHEAAAMTGQTLETGDPSALEKSVRAAARHFQEKGVKHVIITLGEAGAAMIDEAGRFFHAPAVENIRAVDPTAAGDSFIGAFCTAVCMGMAPEDALLFANSAAAVTVSKMGAQPSLPTRKELETAFPAAARLNAEL